MNHGGSCDAWEGSSTIDLRTERAGGPKTEIKTTSVSQLTHRGSGHRLSFHCGSVKPGDDRYLSADLHAHSQPLSHPSARREAMMKQEHVLIGRITGTRVFSVPEFGTRASFTLECSGQCSVACCIAGDVARRFLASRREGDIVAADGIYEPPPSTASPKTPWVDRFRVRALRILESARIAA
jgi:hypothetical protein